MFCAESQAPRRPKPTNVVIDFSAGTQAHNRMFRPQLTMQPEGYVAHIASDVGNGVARLDDGRKREELPSHRGAASYKTLIHTI